MIYFVVAQREDNGEWELFGPWDYIDGADAKIAELDDDQTYAQTEIARVLTDDDNPDRGEWLEHDTHDPS